MWLSTWTRRDKTCQSSPSQATWECGPWRRLSLQETILTQSTCKTSNPNCRRKENSLYHHNISSLNMTDHIPFRKSSICMTRKITRRKLFSRLARSSTVISCASAGIHSLGSESADWPPPVFSWLLSSSSLFLLVSQGWLAYSQKKNRKQSANNPWRTSSMIFSCTPASIITIPDQFRA